MVLALMRPGDFFGELALLDGRPRSADAVAAEDTRLLLLQRDRFLRVLEARPRLAIQLLQVLSERIRRDTQLLQDAVFLDVPGRLAGVLLRLAGASDDAPPAGRVLPVRLSQYELASMVGTTRESVNRWLRAFEEGGLIRRAGRQIVLLRPEELRERIG
jgi:CRP/FNR family cyclic AMP-dependent transcriptional regulator